eukprot:12261319-Heterocapsa_arctica.AAC.1
MACAISLVGQKLVYFKPFERLIGNTYYCQGFRSCTHSVLQAAYRWMCSCRDRKVGRVPVEVPPEVWGEVL